MTAPPASRTVLQTALLVGVLAGGLCLFSETIAPPLRSAVRDSLRPGQIGWDELYRSSRSIIHEWTEETVSLPESPALLQNRPQQEEAQREETLRRWQLREALLQEEIRRLKTLRASPYRGEVAPPVFSADLLEARVLGEETAALWRGGLLLDRGQRDGAREDDLVLQDGGLLVDAGRSRQLETGFPVFAGRCVLGRLRQTGRWSSTVERITDKQFRGRAQLVRKTVNGFLFGAAGVLEGTGKDVCRLTLIPATEPVNVGDDVYTLSDGGVFPFPMYYGKVTRAELPPGASHWKILVQPAAASERPRTVQILCRRFRPENSGSRKRKRQP